MRNTLNEASCSPNFGSTGGNVLNIFEKPACANIFGIWLFFFLSIHPAGCARESHDPADLTSEGQTLNNTHMLDFTNQKVDVSTLERHLAAPEFRGVMGLDLGENRLGSAAFRVIAKSSNTSALRHLSAIRTGMGDEGALALGQSGTLRLERLLIMDNEISPVGVNGLLAGTTLESVKELMLAQNPVGDDGLEALARSPKVTELRRLDLQMTGVGDRGFTAVARSNHLKKLEMMDLSFNTVSNESLAVLAKPDVLPGLRRLTVSRSSMPEETASRIKESRPELELVRGP